MSNKISSTIDKAYGNIPKEPMVNIDLDIPTFRGFKFYWLKLVRKIQGR